ncbi:uridine kinase [bacterium]|nr:uridine kinase [bacterium]MBU1916694.1 uridine kinase [bacterium]
MTQNKKTILIGIAGGTASGKTSVAQAITHDLPKEEIALIEQDSYYVDLSHLTKEERDAFNFDHPDAVNFDLAKAHLTSLLKGNPINVPIYDYTTHTASGNTMPLEEQHIVIIEGILALHDKELRNMMDIKIYVDAPDDTRILRRLERDIKERGRTMESVIQQYNRTVRPMHIQFVEPTKRYADIIVPNGAKNDVAIDILRTKIKDLLR